MILRLLLLTLLMTFCTPLIVNAQTTAPQANPTGYWRTYDEATKKPKSIVKVWVNKDKSVSGKIAYIYPVPGRTKKEVCTICPGTRRNQPYFGLAILEKLTPVADDQNAWTDGEILDPENGKIYSCKMNLTNNGKKLQMRGFVGISMFGRTQTWDRVDASAIPKD